MNLFAIFAPLIGALFVLWILSRVILSEAGPDREARESAPGQLEFAPNQQSFWGAGLFIAIFAYAAVANLVNAPVTAGSLVFSFVCAGIVMLLLAGFPGTIVVSNEGLRQVFWLGNGKRIAWAEVRTVVLDSKRNKLTITSKRGAKIAHTRQLPDRPRLLAELEKHCPDKMPSATGAKTTSQI